MTHTGQPSKIDQLTLRLVAYAVGLHGLITIGLSLVEQLHPHLRHHELQLSGFNFDPPLLFGLSLLYLSTLLLRRKRTALVTTLGLYAGILLYNVVQFVIFREAHDEPLAILRNIGLPLLPLALLFDLRRYFTVKSDIRSFSYSLRISALVLAVTFAYGVIGFTKLDERDFHQEMSLAEAAHRTIDQFDLTTDHPITAHTRRARAFSNSLTVISTGAFAYALISLFQPIRSRLTEESHPRSRAKELIERYPGSSEDFFKIWPEDKHYFFNLSHTACLAYGVRRGVALVVGDPVGDPAAFDGLLNRFDDYCRANDWRLAFVHTEPPFSDLYKRHDFTLQKIGEEALLNLDHFEQHVSRTKYFRQIRNKFVRNEYTTEVLQPPHSTAAIDRLQAINSEWLSKPGREERGFALGYFSPDYMQQCPVMVLRDAAGTIQAFINQVPTASPQEANYDLLRYTHGSLGNANDYLLMEFIQYLHDQGYTTLNLGLCLFAGVGEDERGLINSTLGLLYSKGDRFYSFAGLHRFKAKYEPEWSSRYIAYRGGLSGFMRASAAFNAIAKIKKRRTKK
ncbi:MAG TPA: phosphatidylglycerol lysyltransferase domain-containing protein [Candidatus Saccharimonadales bacterium]|jgi:phosphatidylglycerol lysyltransferase|nr:phosphatidylglycerol lysyltransferase domain-containing protein [Candidatus Saccharimonadales bacterium]